MMNLKNFFKKHDIEFETDKKAVNWLKSLKPKKVVKIGSSYFVDEQEADGLFETYLNKQINLRQKRAQQARKNFTKKSTFNQ